MRRHIVTFLILLPLTILISLSCPIKQDIKQLLGIPVNTSVQIERSSNNSVCIYTLTQNKKSEIKKQYFHAKQIFDRPFVLTDTTLFQSLVSDLGVYTSTSIPIFLIYRKLII